MNNTVKLTLMSALVLGGLGVASTTAHAADVATRNTDAQVKFIPDDSTTNPVDPTDPTNPVDPVDPTDPTNPVDPGTKGPLSLDYASSFDFGVQKITSTDKTYQAKAQQVKKGGTIVNVPNYAQVTDNRGTQAGWKLSVKQNGQFKDSKSKELAGATINIANGSLNTASQDKVSIVIPSFTLDAAGASQDVMQAQPGEGAGTFVYSMGKPDNIAENKDALANPTNTKSFDAAGKVEGPRFETSDVTLKVPGKSVKMADTYSTTMTWTLSDTPAP